MIGISLKKYKTHYGKFFLFKRIYFKRWRILKNDEYWTPFVKINFAGHGLDAQKMHDRFIHEKETEV